MTRNGANLPELEHGWITQDHLDAFARQIDLKPAHVYSLAQVLVERLHEYGLCVYVLTTRRDGKLTYVYKVETESFIDLDFCTLPRVKEIGSNRLEFLKTYQAWLRQASTP